MIVLNPLSGTVIPAPALIPKFVCVGQPSPALVVSTPPHNQIGLTVCGCVIEKRPDCVERADNPS
jgi:hypothetical protein